MKKDLSKLTAIGWREWVSFPEWGVDNIKAKVDTGARTSSLHAGNLKYFEENGVQRVSFNLSPWQRSSKDKVRVSADVVGFKTVKSSSGCEEERPVVRTTVLVAGRELMAELTLTNRSKMGFRMLLGRAAMKKFMVIPGSSYMGGRPDAETRKKNREAGSLSTGKVE
ncbi:MAG: RimK/LysX family protein [Spirochaetales bacterium]|nr:RimK/LysX family protein [Spirochaetales bacterium]